jgi:TonB family protein
MKVRFQPPVPVYPPEAKINKIMGTVIVEITVDPQGVPTRAKAISGPVELHAASEAYALQWRFDAPTLNGIPQYARLKLTVVFNLR